MNTRLKFPENVLNVFNTLNNSGYDCYAVGGVVRDSILGKEPNDWDFTTDAKPEDVMKMFEKSLPTGINHGTATVFVNGESFEITTYRSEGKYSDSRHPDYVEFVETLEEDLSRRDFTINAMALDSCGCLIDPFGGKNDIERKTIRCVGDPNERFSEDPLRMLRAVRFSSKLGFKIDDETFAAIKENCSKINVVSKERVCSELTKILMSDKPYDGFIYLHDTGLLNEVLPDVDVMFSCEHNSKYHYTDVGRHSLDVVGCSPKDKNIRWAALLHDTGKVHCKTYKDDGTCSFHGHQEISHEIAKRICNVLRFSKRDTEEVCKLVLLHDTYYKKLVKTRKFAAEHGSEFIEKLHELQVADSKAHKSEYVDGMLKDKTEFYNRCVACFEDGSAITLKDLKLNGDDLVKLGYKGKEIGNFLNEILERCLNNPKLNDRDYLLSVAEDNQFN